jgi:hypothetical protein
VIRTEDGALVEVQSEGMRHGPAEVCSAWRAASRSHATSISSEP